MTIVTPTYRHARFIRDAVESALAQTFRDWEMVVVDDGSDDGTPDIVESYRDARIRLIRRPHQGLAALGGAYAEALAVGSGTLVAVLEGDDAWPPTKLEIQVPFFDDERIVLSYGPAQLIDRFGCPYATYTRAPRGGAARNDPVGSILPALIQGNFIVSSTVVARRSALERVGGFRQPPGVPFVDHPTWLMLAGVGRFAPASEVVGIWRRHAEQYTTRTLGSPIPDARSYMADALAAAGPTPDGVHRELVELIAGSGAREAEIGRVGRARQALLAGDWNGARSLWLALARTGSPAIRAIAIIGVLSATTGTDVEWLFRRAGRFSWPSRRHMASHGTSGTVGPEDQS